MGCFIGAFAGALGRSMRAVEALRPQDTGPKAVRRGPEAGSRQEWTPTESSVGVARLISPPTKP